MLKEQDIFVRSHLSPLKPEQVALMRARWEREKRKLKEAPAPPKRRRAVKAAAEPVAAAPEERPKRRRRTAAEGAAALFKELPAAGETHAEPLATSPFATPPTASGSGPGLAAPPPAPPRPVIPTPVRPKPVASAAPGGAVPPRPVASAAPGAGPLEERRRDKGKKRKKGKKSLVDQEAVAQNISRTLASIKGPVGRKGVHRR